MVKNNIYSLTISPDKNIGIFPKIYFSEENGA